MGRSANMLTARSVVMAVDIHILQTLPGSCPTPSNCAGPLRARAYERGSAFDPPVHSMQVGICVPRSREATSSRVVYRGLVQRLPLGTGLRPSPYPISLTAEPEASDGSTVFAAKTDGHQHKRVRRYS